MKMDVHIIFQLSIIFSWPFLVHIVHSEALVPDLDLTSPVAGGRSGRQDGMLRNTQARLAVGVKSVQHTNAVVIVEVSGAGGAS